MREIPLGGPNGHSAIVDDDDYEIVAGFSWYEYVQRRPGGGTDGPYAAAAARKGIGGIQPAGSLGDNKRRSDRRIQVRMHALLMGVAGVDHRNGNGLDNRRSNLRVATASQNSQNRRKQAPECSSQYKGVTWHRTNKKWMAYIKASGKRFHLGYHQDEVAAAMAYDEAARKLHGEFASLNFPALEGQ